MEKQTQKKNKTKNKQSNKQTKNRQIKNNNNNKQNKKRTEKQQLPRERLEPSTKFVSVSKPDHVNGKTNALPVELFISHTNRL